MDVEKYLKIKNRMCSTFEDCKYCPNYLVGCTTREGGIDIKEAIKVAEKWDKENPIETRLSTFLNVSKCRNGIAFGVWKVFSGFLCANS